MFEKISLPVVITVMCALLLGVTILTYLNRGYLFKFFNKTTTKTEEVKITRTNYSSVARKTLDWIDKQRGENGWYILERGCDLKAKTCDIIWNNAEGNKDALVSTWARFNFYNQTKDSKDLEIVKSDINKFYEKYPNGVDNTLWICKITYDMWQSNLFDQSTKDKLEKICFNSKFPSPDDLKEYWSGGKSKKIGQLGDSLETWKKWDDYIISLRDFDASVTYSTDFLYRYKWHKNKNDLELAQKYYDNMRQIYKGESFGLNNTCLLGLSSLDMVNFNINKKSNLDYSISLYNLTVASDDNKRTYANSVCGLLSKYLLKETKKNTYLKDLEFNNQILTSFNLDGALNKIVSDNGFLGSTNGSVSRFKSIVDNALIVESLRN